MTTSNIRAALELHLQDMTGLPDIAWQNVPYQPRRGHPFIGVSFQPTMERNAVMGPNAQKRKDGLFILAIHTPKDEGPQEAQAIADSLCDHFNSDIDLEHEGTIVRIRYSEPGTPFTDLDWYRQNTIIRWYVYE